MAAQLPMLFLLLWGGVLGDRFDQRRLLALLYALVVIPCLVMALLIQLDYVNYGVLIGWGIVGGVLGALLQPVRDALLSRVAGSDIQRVVTLVIGIQFGAQIIGFGVASTADTVGPTTILLLQALFMLASVWATLKIPVLDPIAPVERKHLFREVGEGLAIALRSSVIWPVLVLIFSIGVFYIGSYIVLLPLMVRNFYDGGATGIALAFGLNMAGICTTIFFLMRRGGLDRPGRALILSGIFSILSLSPLYFELPEWGFYLVVYLWGLGAGISMTMTRAIVQEAAPESHRSRVMSIYSLAMFGAMPLGSVLLGYCAEYLGERGAVLVPVFSMTIVILFLRLGTNMWQVGRGQDPMP